MCSFGVRSSIIKEFQLHALRESDDYEAGGDYVTIVFCYGVFFLLMGLTGGTEPVNLRGLVVFRASLFC